MTPARWEALKARADAVLAKTMAELPSEILAEARKVPVLYEQESEIDPDLLGMYHDFTLNEIGEANGPIILYLATIEAYCAEERTDFAREVRLTYLHELAIISAGMRTIWRRGD